MLVKQRRRTGNSQANWGVKIQSCAAKSCQPEKIYINDLRRLRLIRLHPIHRRRRPIRRRRHRRPIRRRHRRPIRHRLHPIRHLRHLRHRRPIRRRHRRRLRHRPIRRRLRHRHLRRRRPIRHHLIRHHLIRRCRSLRRWPLHRQGRRHPVRRWLGLVGTRSSSSAARRKAPKGLAAS